LFSFAGPDDRVFRSEDPDELGGFGEVLVTGRVDSISLVLPLGELRVSIVERES